MDETFFDAAQPESSFSGLLAEDPDIPSELLFGDVQFRDAVLTGQTDLAKEIIRRNPGSAKKLDKDANGYPIHLASANCQVELLRVEDGSSQCLLRDKQGRTPLDYAAMSGSTDVISQLLSACSDINACEEKSFIETALLFTIEHNHREAFKVLAMRYMKDWDNETVEKIKTTNKLLVDAQRLCVAAPSTVSIERFNTLLMDAISRTPDAYKLLDIFLAGEPLILDKRSSGSYPLETHLRLAVFAQQTDLLSEKIISRRPEFSNRFKSSTLVLHRASIFGYVEILKMLLTQYGPSSCLLKDHEEGKTALHSAVTSYSNLNTKVNIINELLSACWESVREVTNQGETALHLALKLDHKSNPGKTAGPSIKILLKWHIEDELLNNNRNWDGNATTVSDLADKYIKIVKELFSQDDCQLCLVKNMEGRTDSPLYYAVLKGKNKDNIIPHPKYILEVTAQNQTVVHLSVDQRSLITFKVQLRSTMVTEILGIKDDDGNTVFDLITARLAGKLNFVGVDQWQNYQIYEDVIRLLDVVRMGDLEAFNELVDKDPHVLNKVSLFPLGGTPLNIAMEARPLHTNIVKDIIRRRPDFAKQLNFDGMGPIHIASQHGNVDIVRELLTKVGAYDQCLFLCHKGRTALHHAAQNGKVDVIHELLSRFMDLSLMDMYGNRALLLALSYGHFEASKILMERHILDDLLTYYYYYWDGNHPIVVELVKGYVEIIKELLSSQYFGSCLSILEKKTIEGNAVHLQYYAYIEGISKNVIVRRLSLHPEVTAKGQTVLHLSVDDKSSLITLQVLLRKPSFYNEYQGDDSFYDIVICHDPKQCHHKYHFEKQLPAVENEIGRFVTIWDDELRGLLAYTSDGAQAQQSHEGSVLNEVVGNISTNEVVLNKDGNDDTKEKSPEGAKYYNKEQPGDVENDSREKLPAETTNEERVLGDSNPIIKQAPSPLQDGVTFRSLEECRIAIIDAMVLSKRAVRFQNSGKEKVVVECSDESCEWRITARPKKDIDGFVVKIRSSNQQCPTLTIAKNKLATPTWVSYHVKDEVRKDPEFEPKQIQRVIKTQFEIDISNTTAWRAKIKALERIHGSWTESYKKLPDYLNCVLKSNPESIALLDITQDTRFHRLFISYKVCLNGFLNGCAPLVSIDGIRIEQGLGGVMILAAMGVDGNNEMFPIAFAVADTNSISMWEWFLIQLKSLILQHPGYKQMTVISNHLYGLAEVIKIHFPKAMHGHCTWNLAQIMEKKFGHKILNFYWQIAKALTNEEYNQAFKRLKLKNVEAADWIEKSHPEYWAASKFQGDIYRHITSNVAETFSKWIGPARHLPILAMLEQIRVDLVVLFRERRKAALNSSSCFTEYVNKFIEEAIKASTSYSVIEADNSIYEVRDNNNFGFRIDLSSKSCTCLVWQKLGIPCSHALATFTEAQISPPYSGYCNIYYKTQYYQLAYEDIIKPVLPISPTGFVTTNDILPPTKEKKLADCLIIKRKRTAGSTKEKRVMRCSECNVPGHTKKSCKNHHSKDSTKREPSFFDHVMASKSKSEVEQPAKKKKISTAKVLRKTTNGKDPIDPIQSQTHEMKKNATTTPNLPPPWVQLPGILEPMCKYIPEPMHKYISSIEDVPSDGHCGYHVVAKKLGLDQICGWREVRETMVQEMNTNEDYYKILLGSEDFENLKKRFAYYEAENVGPAYWMQMPEAGFVIAEAYITVVVLISKDMNFTFVPRRYPMSEYTKNRIMVIAHVNGNHYVGVTLTPDAPMPPEPPYRIWEQTTTLSSVAWLSTYKDKINEFERIMGYPKNKDSVIVKLDD